MPQGVLALTHGGPDGRRIICKHSRVTGRLTAPTLSPSHCLSAVNQSAPSAWVGSVGRLAGAASSTRLVTRQTAQAEGTRQGRRVRARHAERRRGAERGALTGSRRAVGSERAWVDSAIRREVTR
jgi:hypothetical protein